MSVAWGSSSRIASAHPAAVTAQREPESWRRRGATPRTAPTTSRALSVRRRSHRPANPIRASVTVSTIAIDVSPFNFEATICVVITRKLPPKTYGAQKDASDVMKVSSAAPERAGAEQRQRDAQRRCASGEAPRLCRGLDERPVHAGEARAREEVEVDVHRVGVDEQDRARARQAPGRLAEARAAPARRARRSRSRRRGRGRRARRSGAAARPAARRARRAARCPGTRCARRETPAARRSRRRARPSRARSRGSPRAPATRPARRPNSATCDSVQCGAPSASASVRSSG